MQATTKACPTPLCQARLATGAPCTYRATRDCDGDRLCGVHARQRASAVECPICMDRVAARAIVHLNCGHAFRRSCIRAWFRREPLRCPMCRGVCLDGLKLLGRRLGPKLLALTRTLPPPPRAFFPAYIVSHLETPLVVEGLGLDRDTAELLVDIACECFTRENFFAKVRALGM